MSANPPPPISQIWQGGFGNGLSALITNGTDQQHQTRNTLQNSNNCQNFTTMNRNNNDIAQVSEAAGGTNNNYVNFTQFIMQHNFLGNNGFGLTGDSGGIDSVNASGNENVGAVGGATNAVVTQVNEGSGGHEQVGSTNDYFNFVDTMNSKANNESLGDKALVDHRPQPPNVS